jgi:hypothetical protein
MEPFHLERCMADDLLRCRWDKIRQGWIRAFHRSSGLDSGVEYVRSGRSPIDPGRFCRSVVDDGQFSKEEDWKG